MPNSILIVDDKIKLCTSLAQNFNQLGYSCHIATNSTRALEVLSSNSIDAVLLDIVLGEENGIELLKKILSLHYNIPVIMITGYASIDTAVRSIKLGAYDYVQKPLDFDQLFEKVRGAVVLQGKKGCAGAAGQLTPHLNIITKNPAIRDLCEKAKRLAGTELPVLIFGEPGAGKEVFADYIHIHSAMRQKNILKINCASFPENLLDNELFGHEKGAYTGANETFNGLFEKADGGSLFLDEIGDMSLSLQAKILRTLQDHEIRRIGGTGTIKVDVRFIAATNKDLESLIREKRFREDLFYRLNAAVLILPSLRERTEDITPLAHHFLEEFTVSHNRRIDGFSDEVIDIFYEHQWPGNIRELKNTVYYAAAITKNNRICTEDLPVSLQTNSIPLAEQENIRETMEKNLIQRILERTKYNKSKAAEMLNISRKTLYNKMEKYSL
ncbi:MAG TPA: sigma-54 dependent transcriptional regulator [Spirochaetota bacterium]|nr:sigma-54 dependent transcriptional regulator [Spirochaetota bacterium]